MLLPLTLLAALGTASAADSLTGPWRITGEIAGNPISTVCTFTQDAGKLAGSCVRAQAPDQKLPVTGEVKDGKVRFQYGVDVQGQTLTVVYSGAFASPRELKGTLEAEPLGATGTFTAVPAPVKP
jgi:hypothetical protein